MARLTEQEIKETRSSPDWLIEEIDHKKLVMENGCGVRLIVTVSRINAERGFELQYEKLYDQRS